MAFTCTILGAEARCYGAWVQLQSFPRTFNQCTTVSSSTIAKIVPSITHMDVQVLQEQVEHELCKGGKAHFQDRLAQMPPLGLHKENNTLAVEETQMKLDIGKDLMEQVLVMVMKMRRLGRDGCVIMLRAIVKVTPPAIVRTAY